MVDRIPESAVRGGGVSGAGGGDVWSRGGGSAGQVPPPGEQNE